MNRPICAWNPRIAVFAPLIALACSGGDGNEPGFNGSGGSGGTNSGGTTANPGSGGFTSTGGASGGVSTGGDAATGGAAATGGSAATGGAASGGADGGSTGGLDGTGGVQTGPYCEPQATLREAAECTNRRAGAALAAARLGESSYTTAAKEFNYVTAENEMKWGTLEPSNNQYNYSGADQIYNFAVQNNMDVKFHALVWHNQLPGWVASLNSPQAVRTAMEDHIEAVMNHYKDIKSWDVVNEAVLTDSDNGQGNPRWRPSVFYNQLGDEYIDVAFKKAREMAPDAQLIYNDYSVDGLTEKADFLYEQMQVLLDRGVPIDALGLQMHIGNPNNTPTPAEIAENMQRFAELGLDIVISEMDVNLCGGRTTDWQLEIYSGVIAACVAQPACKDITFWGMTDKYTWLDGFAAACSNGDKSRSLLWDNNYVKKPTYEAVMKELTGN